MEIFFPLEDFSWNVLSRVKYFIRDYSCSIQLLNIIKTISVKIYTCIITF